VKWRAAALLLIVIACDGERQQSVAQRYREVRSAIERGDFLRARALAHDGANAIGVHAAYKELFATAEAESLARSDPKGALELLAQTPRTSDPEARVRRLMATGYALQAHSDYTGAAATYARADKEALNALPSLRAEIAMLQITPPFHQNQLDTAELFARQAIALAKPSQVYVLANAYGMLGTIEMNRHEWESAITHLSEGARLARRSHARSTLSSITGNLGWCSQQLGDLDDAQARFTEVARYDEAEKVLRALPTWLANIANVYVARQQYATALPYAQRAVEVAREIENQNKLATSLSNLAQVQIELGDYAAAKRSNDEAFALRSRMGDKASQLTVMLNAARIDDGTGAPERALAILQSVITAGEDQPAVRWHAQAIAAEINRVLGRVTAARQMYEAALATGDSARPAFKDEDTYFFTFEANLIRFCDRYIDLLLSDGKVLDALRVAERSRARALRDGLNLAADPRLDPVALARANKAAILWYWLAPERSLVWIVTPDGISFEKLRPQQEIEQTIDAYRSESLARLDGLGGPYGKKLFDIAVRPVLAHARGSRFIIIPDGRLNDIDLETAVVASPQPHYWIDDATVSYAPSLQFLAATKSRPSPGDSHVLVVGDVPAQPGFPALSRAGTEMQNVASHFDHNRQVLLAGLNATRAAFLNADLRNAAYIHLATHSTASVVSPLESSVILAGDQRLTGRDIAATKLSADLVTVSSCSSAGRRSYAGEGLVGLAWAFLRAGAQRVVAAQWDVSDSATSILMDKMYGELAAGHNPSSALHTAKLELLHSTKGYDRPYYWAPFILYGAP
jgi:CHAT domain-containing protein